jgi:hypothetical protein
LRFDIVLYESDGVTKTREIEMLKKEYLDEKEERVKSRKKEE